ncbi:MAG: SDR family NAD(P)-dependent oxidoreductase [Mycobacteriales bacterium]
MLEGRAVLVAGGAGAIGEGVVGQLAEAGAEVVVPSRTQDRLVALEARVKAAASTALKRRFAGPVAPIRGYVGHVGEVEAAAVLRDTIAADLAETGAAGGLDAVVSLVGGWWSGSPLAEVRLDEWDLQLHRSLRAHQVVASTFVPLLRGREGARYTLVTGDSAEEPAAGAGLSSVFSAGALMTGRVLAVEEAAHGVAVDTLVLGPVITRSRPQGPERWLTATEVGQVIVARLAAGEPGAVIAIPDRAAADALTGAGPAG